MEGRIAMLDDHTLLEFCGYALGFSFNLYACHLIPEDTLCEVVVLQEGRKHYRAFQSDNLNDSHEAARHYLFNLELTEGFDIASLVFDGYSRTVGEVEKVESLILQLFTLDSYANRRIVYPYERVRGEIMPLDSPQLIGDWNVQLVEQCERWIVEGMQAYYQHINRAM
jgi:hypothetical protein